MFVLYTWQLVLLFDTYKIIDGSLATRKLLDLQYRTYEYVEFSNVNLIRMICFCVLFQYFIWNEFSYIETYYTICLSIFKEIVHKQLKLIYILKINFEFRIHFQ